MSKRILALAMMTLGAAAAPSCSMDQAPMGLRATPPGPGAMVRFDLSARPLPEIPVPNDIATFADPTSRTGRRINASLVAPTQFEANARQAFSEMEGWGTYAPIWVQFDRPPGIDGTKPALDLDAIKSRMQGDEYTFADDPVYLINLNTGVPAVLDMGNGSLPATLRDPNKYWPNDPHVASNNLLFEDHEEAKGLTQDDYQPALDLDFDGVVDHPNTLGPAKTYDGIDNLLTWYERETDSLILRPLLPLEEKTEYAVVLTDRLTGSDGNPVKSPFPAIHHPSQRDAVARVATILGDSSRNNYYGDIAGSGLDHVAFAWSFTTQPTIEDMILLRNGLYGKGPFARFATDFPAHMTAMRAAGTGSGDQQLPGWDSTPTCAQRAKTPYAVFMQDPDIAASFKELYKQFGYDPGDIEGMVKANLNIDHTVIATFQSPYLEGDPKANDPDAHFHVNFTTGDGDVRGDTVSVWFAIPKTTGSFKQPFPVTLWGHGVGGSSSEVLNYAGYFAKTGLASVGVNMPGHGLPDDPSIRIPAKLALAGNCLVPWTDAVLTTRAVDRNGEGMQLPGWWWWTMHIANVRDNVRQGTLDEMQLTRIMRTFDGKTMSGQDYNNDGKEDLAGDFDGDGTPDIGGPSVGIYAAGESLGGIMSEIQGGIDHQLNGVAPMSGGGGLTDIGTRSYGVTESLGQLMTPLIVSIPASGIQGAKCSAAPPCSGFGRVCDSSGTCQPQGAACSASVPCSSGVSCDPVSNTCQKAPTIKTNCTTSQMSVQMLAEDGDSIPSVELACLNADEDAVNMTVTVGNLVSGEKHCARTLADGSFRVPIGATKGDRLDVQMWQGADQVDSYGTCNVLDAAMPGRHIQTFEQPVQDPNKVADGLPPCPDTATNGCAQFMSDYYPVGDPLIAVQNGMGYSRNTPRFRRFWNLGQGATDPGDPINFAPYYTIRTLPDPDGKPVKPRGLLSINTVGDAFVSIASGFAFARAAGLVPFFPPSAKDLYPEYADYVTPQALYTAYGNRTVNEVYIDHYSIEGVARLGRVPAGPSCSPNYNKANSPVCTNPTTVDPTLCNNALYDVDWLSEHREPFDEQHPDIPMRAARISGLHVADSSLEKAWAPRLAGIPFSADGTAWQPTAAVMALVNVYIVPQGQHTWDVPDVCKLWDPAVYGDIMIAHFLRSGGTDPYYLSHPSTHNCMSTLDCDFLK